MKLNDYLDSTHIRTNIALQQAWSPYGQAKINAASKLNTGLINFFTFVNYLVILFQYLLVLFHITKAPPTALVIIEELKASSELKLSEQKKLLDLDRQAAIDAHISAQQSKV